MDVAVEDGDATAVKNQPVLGLTKEVYAADLKLDAFMEDDGLPDDASGTRPVQHSPNKVEVPTLPVKPS